MRSTRLPDFLFPPWYVHEDDVKPPRQRRSKNRRKTRKNPLKAFPSVLHLGPGIKMIGRRMLKEHGLPDWDIWIEPLCLYKFVRSDIPHRHLRSGDTTGECQYRYKRIVVGIHPDLTEYDYKMTILHEIAHALVGYRGSGPNGHGPKWQKKARELGVSEKDIAWNAKNGS